MDYQPLASYRENFPALTKDVQQLTIAQATKILRDNFVHLPDKIAQTGFDAVHACQILGASIERGGPVDTPVFLEEMLRIFAGVNDNHTRYILPYPWRDLVCFLPFEVGVAFAGNDPQLIVTAVAEIPTAVADIEPGNHITHWNGVRAEHIARHLAPEASLGASQSPEALTVRSLGFAGPPLEDWVVLTYVDSAGRLRDAKVDWQMFHKNGPVAARSEESADLAYNPEALFFGVGDSYLGLPWIRQLGSARPATRSLEGRVFECASGVFGHVSIESFMTSDVSRFQADFRDLVTKMPSDGLVIDIRGNTGGSLTAAAAVMSLLSLDDLPPVPCQMRATEANLALCTIYRDAYDDASLETMAVLLQGSLASGDEFTPLTAIASPAAADPDARYVGPVVLVFDNRSYSAADVFAGQFMDAQIGPTLSTFGSTGGGGANVWTHELLCDLSEFGDGSLGYEPLPGGASFTVSMRRLFRSARSSGGSPVPIEGIGIEPDIAHRPTHNDVLASDPDLLHQAGELLAAAPSSRL